MNNAFPHYSQLDAMDCGPACLRMVAKRYAEIIGSHAEGRDVITGRTVTLKGDFQLQPRQTLILEF